MIDFTLSLQCLCGFITLLFVRKNDSCESCLKSPSQIWTYVMSSQKKKRDQRALVQFCFSLGYSPTQTYVLMKTAYRNNVLSRATIFHRHAFFAAGRPSAVALLRNGPPKTSSMEVMVNTIAAITMKDQSQMIKESGAMFDNFCKSSFSSTKFDRVNLNKFYAICCSVASTPLFRVKLGMLM